MDRFLIICVASLKFFGVCSRNSFFRMPVHLSAKRILITVIPVSSNT